jgi:hypothetical protein
MSRVITDLILNKDEGFSKGKAKQNIIDIRKGGQFGFSPNLSEWRSNQAYIPRHIIPILLEAPQFFQLMPNPPLWVGTLKALIELHCQTIEGLNAGLTVEWSDHPVGGGGELQQEPSDVKQDRTEPVFTFTEKSGMPIQTFLYNWIIYGIMDPNTKTSMLGTLEKNSIPPDMLPSWYTMTCMFIEPDITHTRVMKSWIVTNMMPKTTGEITGKRDLTAAMETLRLTIPFSGISQFSLGANITAQTILDGINTKGANPYLRSAFYLRNDLTAGKTDPDVSSADVGYAAGAAKAASASV